MTIVPDEQVSRQLDAMRAETFELLLLQFGETTEGSLITTTAAGILKRIKWLKAKNAHGYNINIRPAASHLTLLDDLVESQIAGMEASGYEPCVIVETSPSNYQAWLDHGRELTPEEATQFSRILAKQIGADVAAAGRRHAGRLAGFTNRKPIRRLPSGLYPFVRLHEAQQRVFTAAGSLSLPPQPPERTTPRPGPSHPQYMKAPREHKTIQEFHDDPRYDGDLSRADFAYAIYAHSHGFDENKIIESILQRDMRKKGNHAAQLKYAKYTSTRALKQVRN